MWFLGEKVDDLFIDFLAMMFLILIVYINHSVHTLFFRRMEGSNYCEDVPEGAKVKDFTGTVVK
jgi:hypothetical protein